MYQEGFLGGLQIGMGTKRYILAKASVIGDLLIADRDHFLTIEIAIDDRHLVKRLYDHQDRKNHDLFGDRQSCQLFKIRSFS